MLTKEEKPTHHGKRDLDVMKRDLDVMERDGQIRPTYREKDRQEKDT